MIQKVCYSHLAINVAFCDWLLCSTSFDPCIGTMLVMRKRMSIIFFVCENRCSPLWVNQFLRNPVARVIGFVNNPFRIFCKLCVRNDVYPALRTCSTKLTPLLVILVFKVLHSRLRISSHDIFIMPFFCESKLLLKPLSSMMRRDTSQKIWNDGCKRSTRRCALRSSTYI